MEKSIFMYDCISTHMTQCYLLKPSPPTDNIKIGPPYRGSHLASRWRSWWGHWCGAWWSGSRRTRRLGSGGTCCSQIQTQNWNTETQLLSLGSGGTCCSQIQTQNWNTFTFLLLFKKDYFAHGYCNINSIGTSRTVCSVFAVLIYIVCLV